jgi:hypothetical protein
MNRLSLALVHHPVVDRYDQIYTTAVTNMDVHDIARSSITYGLSAYYLVTPITAQRELASTMTNFWTEGSGKTRNQDRSVAMELVNIQSDLEGAIERERALCGTEPLIIATSAKPSNKPTISYPQGQDIIKGHASTILVFGTGHGLAQSIIDRADVVLEPIYGHGDYNHLSVRSAAAIILDRLRGR